VGAPPHLAQEPGQDERDDRDGDRGEEDRVQGEAVGVQDRVAQVSGQRLQLRRV
jgi:hypothetical protein